MLCHLLDITILVWYQLLYLLVFSMDITWTSLFFNKYFLLMVFFFPYWTFLFIDVLWINFKRTNTVRVVCLNNEVEAHFSTKPGTILAWEAILLLLGQLNMIKICVVLNRKAFIPWNGFVGSKNSQIHAYMCTLPDGRKAMPIVSYVFC